MSERRPQLKFLKDQVGYVLDGKKTLEPRPRSHQWIDRLSEAEEIELTYGPRFAPPKVFARAKIEGIEVRPFETVTQEDLEQISRGWEDKTPEEFARVHNEWYAKELAKGYPVVWVYFKIIKVFSENYPQSRDLVDSHFS